MKPLFILSLIGKLLFSTCLQAQDTSPRSVTESQPRPRTIMEYKTSVPGWVIRQNDTLQLGRGSLPSKEFAYLYQETPVNKSASTDRKSAPVSYSGRTAILKELVVDSVRSAEGGIYGLVNAEGSAPFYINVVKAIQAGELLPPVAYRPSAQASPAVPVVVANALLKLKALLDAGTITQAEFDVRKKKLLEH